MQLDYNQLAKKILNKRNKTPTFLGETNGTLLTPSQKTSCSRTENLLLSLQSLEKAMKSIYINSSTHSLYLPNPNPHAPCFQSGLFNQPTVFSSHNKPAPASPNQPRNQPANTSMAACSLIILVVCVG